MKQRDLYDLARFLIAQDSYNNGYGTALQEMKNGGKRSHWIWYIFPQLYGLGCSNKSRRYGIRTIGEAKVYLNHPVLGTRLREITDVVLSYAEDADPHVFMMYHIDARKLKSCMTLFDKVSPNDILAEVLIRFFSGTKDMESEKIMMSLIDRENKIDYIKTIYTNFPNECKEECDVLGYRKTIDYQKPLSEQSLCWEGNGSWYGIWDYAIEDNELFAYVENFHSGHLTLNPYG